MVIRFGDFELDVARLELRREGRAVNVQPRVLETLVFLAQNSPRLVTKEELIAGPWKGVAVSDAAVSQAIRHARAALGEDSTTSKFIETIRGKGFRFRGVLGDSSTIESGPPSARLRPFFGRQRETDDLHRAAQRANTGRGHVVLVHGPAGVGKTRLAQWFASHQRDAGGEVCWGGCREGQSAPPFWPWPELVHRYADTRGATQLQRLAHGLEHELVVVAPELREALGVTAAASAGDESPERAASVLDAIARFVRRASDEASLTLVLEDLHLADDAALRVLEVLTRSIDTTQLMVLGTFRSTEASSRAVLSAALDASLPHSHTVALEGLPLDDVRQWITSAAATPPGDSLVDAIHFSTEGLPLLVEALVQDMPTWDARTQATWSSERPGPKGRIREILGRRLNQLDSATLHLVRTAAVFGEEFSIPVLAAVMGESESALVPRLDLAREHGVLKPASGSSMRFTHALHRDLLYRELDRAECRKQHAAIAKVLTNELGCRPEAIVEAAHHFLEALPYADTNEVVSHAQQAAEWARARHAYARAADYYERALAVLDLGPADPNHYAELLLGLGHTQFVAGAVEGTTATLERIFELTRALRRYDLFCRALLIAFQLRRESVVLDPLFHARIAEALEHVVERDATFAQLQVARAMAMVLISPGNERVAWVQEALALTSGAENKRARLDVLRGALHCALRFTDGTSTLGLSDELLNLAVDLRSPENELEARQWKVFHLLERGRGREYAENVREYAERGAIFRTPISAWTVDMHRVGQHFLSGNLLESEQLAREAAKTAEELVGIVGFLHLVGQLFQIGVELTGADAERVLGDAHAGAARILAAAPKYYPLVTMSLRTAMYRGDPSDAQQYLSSMFAPGYVPPDPLDQSTLCALANLADIATELEHHEAALLVFQLLEPYDGLHMVSASGSIYWSSASYWLGRLCLTLRRRTDATRYLERARIETQQAGSVVYHAWSEYYLAQALDANPNTRTALLESSRRTAQRCGMTRLLTKFQN